MPIYYGRNQYELNSHVDELFKKNECNVACNVFLFVFDKLYFYVPKSIDRLE